MPENAKSRAGRGALLPDSDTIKWVSGNSGDPSESAGNKFFTQTACKKFRPEIHPRFSSSFQTQMTQTLYHGLKLKHFLKAAPEENNQQPNASSSLNTIEELGIRTAAYRCMGYGFLAAVPDDFEKTIARMESACVDNTRLLEATDKYIQRQPKVPLLLRGAFCACAWHFFYNSESLEVWVAIQGALMVIGNATICVLSSSFALQKAMFLRCVLSSSFSP
ncbi:hypothetical protein L2E82_14529 [Cichorium intybus]|uniref:Uncharacterized protein n=1 Tax=Cichorium intybus TaxID=13427 RepID=A0ACB9F0V0_CICIN|nr:hypothetical protein L2E82_14529 [Cichorium intybus]